MRPALIVIAKAPEPGRSKTRLSPPLTLERAARLAEAALADTLACVASTGTGRRVLALDGEPGAWLPRGFEVIPQRGEGLDERLASAFEDVGEPALLVGMDTPQLRPELLHIGLARVAGGEAVLGPAADGGYWAIGLRDFHRELFEGVPMSTSGTFAAQLARLEEHGLSVGLLPPLRDVDLIDDARAVAAMVPRSRFAQELGAAA